MNEDKAKPQPWEEWQVGDRLRATTSEAGCGDQIEEGGLYVIAAFDRNHHPVMTTDTFSDTGWNPNGFEWVGPAEVKYKPGDKVRWTRTDHLGLLCGTRGVITQRSVVAGKWIVHYSDADGSGSGLWSESDFELVSDEEAEPLFTKEEVDAVTLREGDRVKLPDGSEHIIPTDVGALDSLARFGVVHLMIDGEIQDVSVSYLTKVEPTVDSLDLQMKDLETMEGIAREATDDPDGSVLSITLGCHMLELIALARRENAKFKAILHGVKAENEAGEIDDGVAMRVLFSLVELESSPRTAQEHAAMKEEATGDAPPALLEALRERAHRDTNGSTLYAESAFDVVFEFLNDNHATIMDRVFTPVYNGTVDYKMALDRLRSILAGER